MNTINIINNLGTIQYLIYNIYTTIKNMKMKSMLMILLVINILLFFYGLSVSKIINMGSLFFVLIISILTYFHIKKLYNKKIMSLEMMNQNLAKKIKDQSTQNE